MSRSSHRGPVPKRFAARPLTPLVCGLLSFGAACGDPGDTAVGGVAAFGGVGGGGAVAGTGAAAGSAGAGGEGAGTGGSLAGQGGMAGSAGGGGTGGNFLCDEFEMPQPNVGLVEPPGLDGCPDGMARVSVGLCMDRWEAHLVLDGSGEPWSPYFNPGQASVRARSAPGAVPQGYVNGTQAASACGNAGKRLCTRSEWELGCAGAEARVYPYGFMREPGVCNDHREVHPVVELFGTNEDWIWSELSNPCISQQAGTLALTGDFAGCQTPEGHFDLVGNLHEWTADPAGTFKGGFYVNATTNGAGCGYTTSAHSFTYSDYSTGFRCCSSD